MLIKIFALCFLQILVLSAHATGLPPRAKSCEERLLPPSLTVAAVQYGLTANITLEQFFEKVAKQVAEAKTRGAELVLFPELFTLDLIQDNLDFNSELHAVAERTPAIINFMQSLAEQNGIYILAGSSPRLVARGTVNTAYLLGPNGFQFSQDKIFLTPFEKDWGWQPGTELKIVDAPWGRTAILICLDSEMPVLSHLLAGQFPEVILVPSMTEDLSGFRRVRWASQARAIEHRAFVIHTGTVGGSIHLGANYGQASVLTPSEAGFEGLLGEGNANVAEVNIFKLNLAQLRVARGSRGVYPAQSQTERTIPINIESLVSIKK